MDEPTRKVVTLIGFRGCGKTTIGRLLADRLHWNFVDTDAFIERKTGKSIANIFEEESEATFRQLEKEEMHALLSQQRIVISAGGGAILDEETRESVSQKGVSIWLTAKPETIRKRLENDAETQTQRPSLSDKDPAEEIDELLQQREPLYSSSSQITIDTDSKTPDQIVEEILTQLPAEFQKG